MLYGSTATLSRPFVDTTYFLTLSLLIVLPFFPHCLFTFPTSPVEPFDVGLVFHVIYLLIHAVFISIIYHYLLL